MKPRTSFLAAGIALFVLVGTSSLTYAEQDPIIEETRIWKYLLVDYAADRLKYWPERKAALETILNQFPDSQWADDAALVLAGGQASFEEDVTGAITALRQIMEKYPLGHTVVSSWNIKSGCDFDDAWLQYKPSAYLELDGSIRSREGVTSFLEREVLAYFEHLEKYPRLTKDQAQSMISGMLYQQGDSAGAIAELEAIVARHPDLAATSAADREAAAGPDGYLIGHEPPVEVYPIWRTEYYAYKGLINLYQEQGNKEKALATGIELASICTYDGWYWATNRRAGDLCGENGFWAEAVKQYELALQGCQRCIAERIQRKKTLDEAGYIARPPDFVSFEHSVLEVEGWGREIAKLEGLVEKARSF